MSGELDAAGTAIEGALLGAALEPARGAAAAAGDGACLNCGAHLTGAYCATCGQKGEVHRTLSAIWHDILHSVLHFDGKFWRTLPLLLFRPGELTRRYVHGERSKFVSPMALFLFSIFLMFAVFSFTGGGGFVGNRPDSATYFGDDLRAEATELDREIARVSKSLADPQIPEPAKLPLRVKLADLKSERNGIAYAITGKPVFADAGTSRRLGDGASLELVKIDTGWAWLDDTLNAGGSKMIKNPGLALYKLQSNGYKFAWLLIPLSLPFVWMVTLGARGHRFYDHAVFATYSIAFMCLLFLTVSILAQIGVNSTITGALFAMVPPLHLYKQLRYSYGFSRASAILRLIFLMFAIFIVIALFFMILLFLGILG